MFVIKIQEAPGSDFSDHPSTGEFAHKLRAEGAVMALRRTGETRPMRVEVSGTKVNPGRRDDVREVKEAAKVPRRRPSDRPQEMTLTGEQVAQLLGSLRPAPSGSGEFILDLDAVAKLGQTG